MCFPNIDSFCEAIEKWEYTPLANKEDWKDRFEELK